MATLHQKALDTQMFKDGKRVLVTKSCKSNTCGWNGEWETYMNKSVGHVGIIDDNYPDSSGIVLRFEGPDLQDCNNDSYPAHCLTVLPDGVTSVEMVKSYSDLSIGDKVFIARKTISKDAGYEAMEWPEDCEVFIGQLATVAKVDRDDTCTLTIAGNSQIEGNWFPVGCIAKIIRGNDVSTTTSMSGVKATRHNTKIGDKVKVVKKYGGNWNNSAMDCTIGKVGTIKSEPSKSGSCDGVRVDMGQLDDWWYDYESLELLSTTSTLEEQHADAISRLNFRNGEKVILTKKATSYSNGWNNTWEPAADAFIGKVGTINDSNINQQGVYVTFQTGTRTEGYPIPAFCLERAPKESTPKPLAYKKDEVRTNFKIGERVKIVNSGNAYTSYSEKFKELGFRSERNNYCSTDEIGTIFGLTTHDRYSKDVLVAVNLESGRQVLIGIEGIVTWPTAFESVKIFAANRAKEIASEKAAADKAAIEALGRKSFVAKDFLPGSGREVEITKSALGYQVVVGPSAPALTTEVPSWKSQIKESFPDFKMLVLG